MNNAIELILILSMIISSFTGIILISSIILGYFLYDRLDKPNGIKRMRLLCHVIRISTFLYIILKVVQFGGLFVETKYYTHPSGFNVIMTVVTAFIGIYFYFRYCRYYLKNRDDDDVLAGWYMKKYFSIKPKNDKNIEQAYKHLQKTSELKSDVFIWSMMAMINERCFDKSDLADGYLEKARQTLNVSGNPSIKDKAVLEATTGDILLCRGNVEDGLTHLKNASDLDPPTYRERYEKELNWANEDEESEDS